MDFRVESKTISILGKHSLISMYIIYLVISSIISVCLELNKSKQDIYYLSSVSSDV